MALCSALIAGLALGAPAPEPLGTLTVVLPAAATIGLAGTAGSAGATTLGGALAYKSLLKLGFIKGNKKGEK